MLEHINLRVPSIAKTQAFLGAAFPDFRERGSGYGDYYGYWSHFGNDDTYVALLQGDRPGDEPPDRIPDYEYQQKYRLMHLAYVVKSVDELMERLRRAGYEPDDVSSLNSHPWRRRVYYLDDNGIEYEFIEYLSDNPARRNDYSL